MKTLVLANQKGGVGKSAIGTQLAFYAVTSGLRVLYIDLDHQQHYSSYYAIQAGNACALLGQ